MVLFAKRVSALAPPPTDTSVSSASLYFITFSNSSWQRSGVSMKEHFSDQQCLSTVLFRAKLSLRGSVASSYPEYATPTLTRRKRAGAAPWPVPIVCCGCPLPQFGVPHKVQWLRSQIASQEFQNSVVMPL